MIFSMLGSATFPCVMGSRLIVNLREEGKIGTNGGDDTAETISTVGFSQSMVRFSQSHSEYVA